MMHSCKLMRQLQCIKLTAVTPCGVPSGDASQKPTVAIIADRADAFHDFQQVFLGFHPTMHWLVLFM